MKLLLIRYSLLLCILASCTRHPPIHNNLPAPYLPASGLANSVLSATSYCNNLAYGVSNVINSCGSLASSLDPTPYTTPAPYSSPGLYP